MKQVLSIYLLTSMLISIGLFYFSYKLRLQPMYELRKLMEPAAREENLSHIYSLDYIAKIKAAYFEPRNSTGLSFLKPELASSIPNDSIFVISLRQIIASGTQSYSDFPTVKFGNATKDTLFCSFHVKAKENFDVTVTLKKTEGKYLFNDISNLPILLHYYPENLKAFDHFNVTIDR